jgi:phosphatidylglycerophosphate synthase
MTACPLPPGLRRRWFALAGLDAGVVAVAFAVLSHLWAPQDAARWAFGVGAALIYQLWFVDRRLADNHRQRESTILSTLGPGNLLTLFRSLLLSLMIGFLFVPKPVGWLAWSPAVLYTLADVSDYFDGYLARISQHATTLGEALDLEYDSLGLLAGVTLAIHFGSLSPWFLVFGLARYAFVGGKWLLGRAGRPTRPLPESVSRRPIAGLTMGFMSAMLWPIMTPALGNVAGSLFAIPFTASFGRDWLVVSGAVDPQSPSYQALRKWAKAACQRWLPIGLRLMAAVALVPSTIGWLEPSAAGSPWSVTARIVFAALEGMTGVLMAAGAAGRTAALICLFPLGLASIGFGVSPIRAAALISVVGILILGTGAASAWQPEDRIFRRRAGEPG